MRNLSLAVAFLLLRIVYGSREKGEELPPSGSSPTVDCHFALGDCTVVEESLRQLCSRLFHPCHTEIDCNSRITDCFNAISESYINETPRKRNPIGKNSFLFLKLYPVLSKAADSNLRNVPTRYRRIKARLGSEFLGKRSGMEEEVEGGRRDRTLPGTELLGKRHGSRMVDKRNVEMLGKRGGEFLGKRGGEFLGKKRGDEFLGKRGDEFLGKRGDEFLGKRGDEFLGKRGDEFLGKRGDEFLGKRGDEFLGKRGDEFLGKRNQWVWTCGDEEDCYVRGLPRVLVQYFKVAAGTEIDSPETANEGSSPPDSWQPTESNSLYFLEKL